MKKLIIFALSLFVILTPTVSYACEDTGDCDVWVNWNGQIYGSKEDCESDASSGLAGGCEGVGGSVADDWDDEEDSGGDADGYFYCCGTDMGEFTSLSSCNDECSDGWCGQGATWEEVCDSESGSDYDTSDPCAAEEVVDQNDCLGLTAYDEYGWAYSCTTGDEGSGRCATDTCMECGGHTFEINCDYLRNFVVGVNLGTIYVDTSDCGEYSPSFLKVCESDDTECQNHMQINACAYSSIIRGVWGGEDIDTTLNLTDVNMYANENYGASCYVPLDAIDGICEYGPLVVNRWDEGSSCDDIDSWGACMEHFNAEKCEEFISSHCDMIFAALDADFDSSGDVSETRDKFINLIANSCPTNVERCDYLYAAFHYYDNSTCSSPCSESGSLYDVCSQFGDDGSDEYKNCVNTLNNTFQCNNMIENYDYFGDCSMDYYDDDDEPWEATEALRESGLSCFFAEFSTDGYNCVVLDAMLKRQLECSGYEDEETGQAGFDCWTEDSSWLSPYSSDTQMYLQHVVDGISANAGDAYIRAVEDAWEAYNDNSWDHTGQLEYAATKLGITCKPLCDYQDIFDSIENNGYTGNACNIRNLDDYTNDSQEASRVLQYCADYNNLFSAYQNGYDPSAEITTIAGHACYDGRDIDISDLTTHDCIYMQMFYDEYKNYDNCTEIWGEELGWCIEDNIDDFADYICNGQSGSTAIARCKYYIKNHAVGYTLIAEEFEVWDEDGNDIPINDFDDFTNYYGVTCADSCGEGQYNRRGQCHDCELPTSKYEDFAHWTPGSTKCAHTYDTIENAGLKIYDLKCELADDSKGWDCTYNALECGGGYYDASDTQFQDGSFADYECNGDGFDSLGRPLCVDSSWQYECTDYDEDGNCLVGLDFYYPYDLEQECNGSDWSDELDMYVYSCESIISARAIDMLRCDTPVPMGYYGLTNFSQEGWNGKYAKQACSVGDYQDETGKTSCKDCPAYGVKSTTNVTVYGTTESTASTDITACKIPSSYSFKGGHGTYKFNPSCSYSK